MMRRLFKLHLWKLTALTVFHIDKGSKRYVSRKFPRRAIIKQKALQWALLSAAPFSLRVFAFLRISTRAPRLQQLEV